jgi:hypothetical protein
MGNRDTDAILDYHESTKHSEWSVRTSRHTLDWDNLPARAAVNVYSLVDLPRVRRA